MRLNNFVAPADLSYQRSKSGANPHIAQKFSNIREQAASDGEEEENLDDYEDDFESLSKSQVGLSMNKAKRPLQTDDSYSNEQFESLAESKNLASSNDDKIVCFVCKQHILKSQALSHH